ncbi:hypothetical protein ZYGR_0AF01130 [Zygosaccharomyces rouxii]|uniref:Protein SOK1 n=1 Tax=Zygosaccharomyces rouxii TaxID=4956 RepID=A0A1Q3A7F6_ZYGRO|nr:hypothetical protein ZYGR_0AF01130 [Zygosaccharomyces rouxii]
MEQARPHRSTVATASSESQTASRRNRSLSASGTTNTRTTTATVPQQTDMVKTTNSPKDQHGINMNTNEEGGNSSSNNTGDRKRLSTCSQEHGPGDATTQAGFPPAGSLLVRKYTELVSSIGNQFANENAGGIDEGGVDIDVNDNLTEDAGAEGRELQSNNENDGNVGRIGGVNEEENEDNLGSGLFKQFDHRTGQFLRRDPFMAKEDIGVRRLFGKSDNKFRSHSVPAICHSSLKRLTTSYCQNHNHYHYRQHNNQQKNAGSVKKKRAGKSQHHYRRHHHSPYCFVQSTPVVAFANSSGTPSSTTSASTTTSTTDSGESSVASSRESSGCVNGASSGNDTGATSFGNDPKQPAPTTAVTSTADSNAMTGSDAHGSGTTIGQSSTNLLLRRSHHQGKNHLMSSNALRDAILLCHQVQQPLVTKYDDLTLQERINAVRDHPGPLPLPPINLQCLKEIDLQEIVKNPQLRHDIIFDPLLQFRPNLDGERGLKKKQLSDKYWRDVENEVYVYSQRPQVFQYDHTRLVPLFDTLREVLLTIVPQREAHVIHNVLDTELNVQELLRGSLIMTNLSEWLAQLFKHHCAPMRDAWVDRMSAKFKEAEQESSLSKLIDGLRLVFQILEAMKLDIANHQIRILRPALLSNSVEFEKQYFQSLMSSDRVDLKSSLIWFNRKFNESVSKGTLQTDRAVPRDVYKLCIHSIISLLSCRKMVREYPTSLSFDHARLILLRADIRQIVCLLICRLLFKQLVANDTSLDKGAKNYIDSSSTQKKLKGEIVSIITDEHGNCRWTKNTMAIAIHLCKTITDLRDEYLSHRAQAGVSTSPSFNIAGMAPSSTPALAQAKVDFAKSWLSKQTQPLSEVYGVLEDRVFRSLEELIFSKSDCTVDGRVRQDFVYLCSNVNRDSTMATTASTTSNDLPAPTGENVSAVSSQTTTNDTTESNNNSTPPASSTSQNTTASAFSTARATIQGLDMEEFDSVLRHLYAVVNFHWSVFGSHYMDAISDQLGSRSC